MFFWDADPVIFAVGPFSLRWYGLFFAVGFVLGFIFMKRRFLENDKPAELLDSLLASVFVGTIVGARLGHCFFYEPQVYLREPWRILMVWEGGLASHGGAIGVFIALLWFTRKYSQISISWLLDRMVFPVAIVAGFIRLGNLMNSEIIGRPTSLPWGVAFKRVDNIPRHPSQIYESMAYFAIAGILYLMSKYKSLFQRKGFMFGLSLILIFGFRFFIEFIKERQVDFESRLPIDMGQLLSIPFIIAGVAIVISSFRRLSVNTSIGSGGNRV